MQTYSFLEFANYDKKMQLTKEKSDEKESVITGTGVMGGCKCIVTAFESVFMMGSMVMIAGETITGAFRFATRRKIPVVTFSAWKDSSREFEAATLIQAGDLLRLCVVDRILNEPKNGAHTAPYVMVG